MYHSVVAGLAKPILSSVVELKPVLTSVQVRYWRYNRKKVPFQFIKPVVPVENLSLDEPVTSSINFGDMGKARKFEWDAESLNARGFHRFQKEYKPPSDAEERILQLSREVIPQLTKLKGKDVLKYKITDVKIKFELLSKAFSHFNHSVPNSMVYMMMKVGHVVDFYKTEIKTTTPFDELVRSRDDLPPNLYIQPNYARFNPETADAQFGGLTAFPKSSTLVTGLRSKKIYRGFEAKKSWP